MKRILFLLALIPGVAFGAGTPSDGLGVRDSGNSVETYAYTVTTITANRSNIVPALGWDANCDIFNNSAYTVWIGSNTTTLESTGFPLISSTTYTLDGSFRGPIYAITEASAGANTANVRVSRFKRDGKAAQ